MVYTFKKVKSDIGIKGRILKKTVATSWRLSIWLPCTKVWRRPKSALFTHAKWGGGKTLIISAIVHNSHSADIVSRCAFCVYHI